MFSVQNLGNPLECKDYVVSLVVHRSDEEDLKGAHMLKLSGEPFPFGQQRVSTIVKIHRIELNAYSSLHGMNCIK